MRAMMDTVGAHSLPLRIDKAPGDAVGGKPRHLSPSIASWHACVELLQQASPAHRQAAAHIQAMFRGQSQGSPAATCTCRFLLAFMAPHTVLTTHQAIPDSAASSGAGRTPSAAHRRSCTAAGMGVLCANHPWTYGLGHVALEKLNGAADDLSVYLPVFNVRPRKRTNWLACKSVKGTVRVTEAVDGGCSTTARCLHTCPTTAHGLHKCCE